MKAAHALENTKSYTGSLYPIPSGTPEKNASTCSSCQKELRTFHTSPVIYLSDFCFWVKLFVDFFPH